MDMYARYIKERENSSIIQEDYGFITYKVEGDICLVIDVYVVPECRDGRAYLRLGNAVIKKAKSLECKVLHGFVSANAINPTDSMKNLLAFGFKIISAQNEQIVLVKEL